MIYMIYKYDIYIYIFDIYIYIYLIYIYIYLIYIYIYFLYVYRYIWYIYIYEYIYIYIYLNYIMLAYVDYVGWIARCQASSNCELQGPHGVHWSIPRFVAVTSVTSPYRWHSATVAGASRQFSLCESSIGGFSRYKHP